MRRLSQQTIHMNTIKISFHFKVRVTVITAKWLKLLSDSDIGQCIVFRLAGPPSAIGRAPDS